MNFQEVLAMKNMYGYKSVTILKIDPNNVTTAVKECLK